MSSSPVAEPVSPSPPSPALPSPRAFVNSTPNFAGKKQQPPLSVILPPTAPATPPAYGDNVATVPGEPTLTPPPRSPGAPPPAGDAKTQPPDGTSSDKSSETAVGVVARSASSTTALSRKESYKAQRLHYRREKKRAASALLHSIEDPSVVVLADWLKVRGSLKSWTKLWCVLKPGLLLLYKSPKAKSSQWVGTVLLASCQVIERPSKKDGFCFKLYHPLEQSIWAPRGPHNETIGAVVQPLPTAHLIFRAPSQAAGHCWLDGLELALRCSNAMLRCSAGGRGSGRAAPSADALSHEELEKHFNEHVLMLAENTICTSPALLSVADYVSDSYKAGDSAPKSHKPSKWTQFVESLDLLSKDNSSSSESEKREHSFLDFLRKKEQNFDRNAPATSSLKITADNEKSWRNIGSKSLASSPLKIDTFKKSPILKCFDFDMPKLPLKREKMASPTGNIIEENLFKFVNALPKRRSSTPCSAKTPSFKRISELRTSGVKTDSENDETSKSYRPQRTYAIRGPKVLCTTPDNFVITKTAPSVERFRKYSSSSTDEACDTPFSMSDKYSLLGRRELPSRSFEALTAARWDERAKAMAGYVSGDIVRSATELAGAASDTDSEGSRHMPDAALDSPRGAAAARAQIEAYYTEDTDREIGAAGELVEEVAEENKSLLWFLMKQVRPGMDLSKVVLPTFILEPRSFLDKLSDNYYHADILGQAQLIQDPYDRFKCVLRWYLSGLYKKPKGLKKPYNPVLGETFRCCWKHGAGDTYTYYVSEQVSHHPPVSAFYVSNRKDGYVIEGSLLARSKFYGNSTSAILEGCARVYLLNHDECYITTAPYAHCKGIVIGTLSMELGGKVHVTCEQTGYHADVEFKLRSFLGSAEQTNSVSGRIKKGKDTIATVDGYWDGKIDIKDKRTGEESTLMDVSSLKDQRLPRYLMKLQHQHDYESQKLWLKVSEAIQNDDQIAATEQKTIIEEAQRTRARNLVAPWVPRFFHRDQDAIMPEGMVDQGWRYNHSNVSPWSPDEQFEYEDEFVIQSVCVSCTRPSEVMPLPLSLSLSGGAPALAGSRLSDSDTHDDLARRSKTSTRTLKQSLHAIDASIREQTLAIERLTKNIEILNEGQRQGGTMRPQNVGRVAPATHSWDILGGFVIAIVLQALLNWIFYQKD